MLQVFFKKVILMSSLITSLILGSAFFVIEKVSADVALKPKQSRVKPTKYLERRKIIKPDQSGVRKANRRKVILDRRLIRKVGQHPAPIKRNHSDG